MGAVVRRSQILAKKYAIMILREDMGMTWDKVGKAMDMNPRVCNELYLQAIRDEAVSENLFHILWI